MAPASSFLHRDPHSTQSPASSSLSSLIGTASAAGAAIAHYGKGEWDYRTGAQGGHAQVRSLSLPSHPSALNRPFLPSFLPQKPTFPRPSLSTTHRTNSIPLASPSSGPPPPLPARKVPPPPRPVFPLSPPNSPEEYYAPPTYPPPAPGKEKDLTLREMVHEEDELEQALAASLRAKPEPVRPFSSLLRRPLLTLVAQNPSQDSEAELQHAIAESQALEARRSTLQSQEEQQLEAALLASQRPPSPVPPSLVYPTASTSSSVASRSPSPYRSLPSFLPTDLDPSHYPSEKSQLFPQGRPALPPGAGSAYDDEAREMELLSLAIRLSEEEEKARRRIEEEEERALLEQLRSAERESLQARGITVTDDQPAADGGNTARSSYNPTLSPSTSGSVASPATTAATSFSSQQPPGSPQDGRRSWFKPPLASKLSSATADEAPITQTTPRPSLAQSPSSFAPTVASYRTAPDSLPFSNLTSLHSAAPPIPPHPPSRAVPPPPRPSRLPPSPPHGDAPYTTNDSSFLAPPELVTEEERFRRDNDGSPYEMPTLAHSNSVRSRDPSSLSRSFRTADERVRTISGTSGAASQGSHSPSVRSESQGREDDEGDEDEGSQLAIRNPDSLSTRSSSTSVYSTTSSNDANVGANVDEHDIEETLVRPHFTPFDSAYAGRSLSLVDEATEPASSVVGVTGHLDSRQGSFPSTIGAVEDASRSSPPVGTMNGGKREHGEGVWMGGKIPFPTTASPGSIGPSEGGHLQPTHDRDSSTASSFTPATSAYPFTSPSLAESYQVPIQSIPPTPVVAAPSSSHPLPLKTAGGLPLPPDSPSVGSVGSIDFASHAETASPPLVLEDGLRVGYPSDCARQPGHTCPHDGLSSGGSVPAGIILSSSSSAGGVGLGLSASSEGGRMDAFAVEARSWVALLRFLMWYGDTTLSASKEDLAASPSRRCAAEANLEFRQDDEGNPVIRLVLSLLPSDDPASNLPVHRELSVSHPFPPSSPGATDPKGKGKGKAKSRAPDDSPHPQRDQTTFSLPDVLHLPTRLSSLAIQLYTLRHLASIARATQPSVSPGSVGRDPQSGYGALRELADEISKLVRAAMERERHGDAQGNGYGGRTSVARTVEGDMSAWERGGGGGGGSGGRAAIDPMHQQREGAGAPRQDEEQQQRLVDRLKERLRRLKRSNHAASGGGGAEENAGEGGGRPEAPRRSSKLVKPQPPPRTQPVLRSERVLSAARTVDWEDGMEDGEGEGEGERETRDEVGEGMMAGGRGREERPRPRHSSTESNMRFLPVLGSS